MPDKSGHRTSAFCPKSTCPQARLIEHVRGAYDNSECDLDVKSCKTYCLAEPMLPIFVGLVARCAIVMAAAFLLSRALPRNKVLRFVVLFVLCVPLNFAINCVDVAFLGYHKMGWTGAFIIPLFVAICGTFWPPQTHKSNAP